MSAAAPQVLLRKPSGTSNGTAGGPSDHGSVRQRTRRSEVNSGAPKSGKGKGAADRRGPTKNASEGDAPKVQDSPSKSHNEGEKVVIRRLPPGMTEQEVVTILGPDWQVSKGKVDWFSYVPGKVASDPSKLSRPSRAYLHLMRKDDIMPLGEVVRKTTWEDAKATFTNPALVGPPVLEFSLYKKIAGAKKRTDARQGTIDQDPEFMAFLESLANPPPMRESIDVEDPNDMVKAETKITTTPLVEYLREKKANKAKDGGSAKNAKSGGKGKSGVAKDEDASSKKKGKDAKGDRTDKTPTETVKILTKKVAPEQAAETAKKVASQMATTNPAATTAATTTTGAGAGAGAASGEAPKSRRAGIAAAARILQRDLGLSPGSAHRRARHDAAKAGGDDKATVPSAKEDETKANETAAAAAAATVVAEKTLPAPDVLSAQTPKGRPENAAVTKPQPGRRTRGGKNAADKGAVVVTEMSTTKTTPATAAQQTTCNSPPVILRKNKNGPERAPKAAEPQPSSQAPSSNVVGKSNGNIHSSSSSNNKQGIKENRNTKPSQKKESLISTNATCAFVKNANASQGVNDGSLRQALGGFGTITLVEIDKRKSFAYVHFAEHDALVEAIAASPLSIGQASVQILERKDKKPAAAATSTACAKDVSAAQGEKEKASGGGRGRRGRGGGGGGKAGGGSANGQNGSVPVAASKGGAAAAAAPASTGG